MTPSQAKVAAIRQLPIPRTVTRLCSKLGFMNYYRVFMPRFSATANPLNHLLRKDVTYEWDDPHKAACEQLKESLCTEGLALRRPDYILHTDWLNVGISAALGQKDDAGNEYLVSCVSRSLNKLELNYTAWQGELLAAIYGMKSFKHYLQGMEFTLCTNHQPLLWLSKNLRGLHARWALAVQDFNFKIPHRPGVTHQNADIPSRFPCMQQHQGSHRSKAGPIMMHPYSLVYLM
eukprot:jgi/Chrzof1/2809/UNPLg00724.t1